MTTQKTSAGSARFIQTALKTFGVRIIGLGLQFAGSILIARLLGPAGFGAYVLAFTWATIIGSVLALGLGQLAIREIPRLVVAGQVGAQRRYLRSMLATILLSGGLAAVVLAVLEMRGILVLVSGWHLAALLAVVHGLTLGLSTLLQGYQRVLYSQMFETVGRQALYVGAILALFWLGYGLDPRMMILVFLITAVPALLMMYRGLPVRLFSSLPQKAQTPEGAGETQNTPPHTRRWLGMGIPLLMMAMAQQLMTDVDILMLGQLMSDTDVGLYRAAARGATLVVIANMIGVQVLGPMLSRALARQEMDEAQRLLTRAALVSAGLGLSICAVLAAAAGIYLGLFGAAFVAATGPMYVLLAGQAISILTGAVATVLVMLDRDRIVLMANSGALALNIGLNYVLISHYGLMGAALATALSMAVLKGGLLIVTLRSTTLNPTLFRRYRR